MNISELFLQKRANLNSLKELRRQSVSEDGVECPHCHKKHGLAELKAHAFICPDCQAYLSMEPMERIALIADEDSFQPMFCGMQTKNPLDFPGYQSKLEDIREKTGQEDAIVTGIIQIGGIKTAIGVLDSRFLMGSMGTVVGEQVALLAEYAARKKYPLLLFSASGGARMQEGLFSLMQMAKTAGAVAQFKEAGGLYISCLTNPTTGGVSASFASLGDIIIAEPNALICFAGPRVVEQTIGQKLPEGFQRAEFLMEHGMLDMIVERADLRETLRRILLIHQKAKRR
ncbi:MAG: acetyl-CoA carboxylase, carboxyltransferase subunit beta [Lachnospiraceae bacterium]